MINRAVYFVFVVCFLGVFSAPLEDDHSLKSERRTVVVATTTGLVRGEQGSISDANRVGYRFRSIPFAEPPVGDFRFEAPLPVLPWDGVLDVTKKGAICLQGTESIEGSEDCLFVKIYTPKTPNKNDSLPVVVWVYGGAFYMGAPDFDGGSPELLLRENVIIASFHYRVGVFGFLSTGDDVVSGNVGLKDQVLALQWIKDNIANFGGDPERITLMGQSAGSSSIAYLLQAPQTEGLYSGAIMLSGATLNTWSLSRNPLEFTKSLASAVQVSTANTREMVEGLRAIDSETLLKASTTIYNRMFLSDPTNGLPLGPVIELANSEAVITGKSHDLLKNGKFNKVPIIIGHTSLEALSSNGISDSVRLLLRLFNTFPGLLVPAGMNVKSAIQRSTIGRKIKNHYFGGAAITSSDSKALKLISDDQFVRGIHESVRLYSKEVPVYYYTFAYEGALYGTHNRTISGVGHNEDLGYLFDFGHSGSEQDYLVRNRLVKLITNFAKYGNPTPKEDSLLQNIQWPANRGETDIIQLNITGNLEIVTNPLQENMEFWNNTFTQYGSPPYDTY